MKIAISSDHTGIDLKKSIIEYLKNEHQIEDLGHGSSCKNYAVEGIKVGETVACDKADCGIVICGSGVGISIATNKVRGIRCALVYNQDIAKLAKEHNNANVIALAARYFSQEEIFRMIDEYLNASFEGQRHEIRVDSIEDYESSCVDC